MKADEFLFLYSGLPEEAPVSLHGVSFVLGPDMQAAWRAAGSHVVYHNERLMKIQLLIKGRYFMLSLFTLPHLGPATKTRKRFIETSANCALSVVPVKS